MAMAALPTTLHSCLLTSMMLLSFILLLVATARGELRMKLSLMLQNSENIVLCSEDLSVLSFLGILQPDNTTVAATTKINCTTDNEYVNVVPMFAKGLYKLELAKSLDYEEIKMIGVELTCNDDSIPKSTALVDFNIVVTDINDNPPIFEQETYTAFVQENGDDNTKLVVKVTANDKDSGENADFDYAIFTEDYNVTDMFEIQPETGEIYPIASLDHEEKNEYVLILEAFDDGGLGSTATLIVKVLDVNDNSPIILTKEMSVQEGIRPMTVLGRVLASDADSGLNGEVTFSKVDDSDTSSSSPFVVQDDGTVLALVSLDRELRGSYSFYVTATDGGKPALSSVSLITIKVADINDNPPIVLQPRDPMDDLEDFGIDPIGEDNINTTIVVNWRCPEDREVYQAKAYDKDQGENGRITYTISSINEETYDWDSLFNIDSTSGIISLRRCVRKSDSDTQILRLSFTDNGLPSLTAFATLNVTLDVDLSVPTTTADGSGSLTADPSDASSALSKPTWLTISSTYLLYFILLNVYHALLYR